MESETARPSMSTHGLESLRVNKLMTNGTLFFLENVTGYSMNKGDRVFLRNCTAHRNNGFYVIWKKAEKQIVLHTLDNLELVDLVLEHGSSCILELVASAVARLSAPSERNGCFVDVAGTKMGTAIKINTQSFFTAF